MNRLEFTSNTHGCRVKPHGVHIQYPRMSTRTAWSSHPTPTDDDSNRLEFTSDAHGCRLEPLGVHIRRPRMPTRTAWSSDPTSTDADLNHLEIPPHGCRVKVMVLSFAFAAVDPPTRMSSQIAWCTFSTHSTAIHGRMLHVSLDHDGAVMVLIAEAAKEKYDE